MPKIIKILFDVDSPGRQKISKSGMPSEKLLDHNLTPANGI